MESPFSKTLPILVARALAGVLALACASLLVGQEDGVPWIVDYQTGPWTRPWPVNAPATELDRKGLEDDFAFPEPIPADWPLDIPGVTLIALPDSKRVFHGNGGTWPGFELLLVNPTAKPLRFRFPGESPAILREAFDGRWRPIESPPLGGFCGNSDTVVDLPPGHLWRFVVPRYGGDLIRPQRFRVLLPGGPIVSNEFEGRSTPGQFEPPRDGDPVLVSTSDSIVDGRESAPLLKLPMARAIKDLWAEAPHR
jgi:hypothetical protein